MCWIDLAGGGGAGVLGSKTYQLLHKLKQTRIHVAVFYWELSVQHIL